MERKRESSFILGNRHHWGNEVLCPECGISYNHFGTPIIVSGNDNYDAWEGKGDLIIIPAECESFHKWEICFGFHKGQNFCFTRIIEDGIDYDSFVYFVKAEGLDKIKIGTSKEPKERLKQLQTGSPVKLSLMAIMSGNAKIERELHQKFSHLLADGEWYYYTSEIEEYINLVRCV